MTLDYRRSLTFLFDDPDWPTTLLLVTLALLVPLVGPIVALGYQATVIEALARDGVGAAAPRFVLDRLADYLLRGLRIWVVTLVLTLLVVPVAFAIVLAGNLFAAVLFGQENATANVLGCLVVAVIAVLFTAAMVGAVALVTPLLVRAAIASDIGAVFDLDFLRDFLARTWRETLVAHLFHVVLNVGLFVAGALACLIGVFPALAIGTIVQAHLLGQLYLLHLERGGRRVGPA
jgi:hypothetical protein